MDTENVVNEMNIDEDLNWFYQMHGPHHPFVPLQYIVRLTSLFPSHFLCLGNPPNLGFIPPKPLKANEVFLRAGETGVHSKNIKFHESDSSTHFFVNPLSRITELSSPQK